MATWHATRRVLAAFGGGAGSRTPSPALQEQGRTRTHPPIRANPGFGLANMTVCYCQRTVGTARKEKASQFPERLPAGAPMSGCLTPTEPLHTHSAARDWMSRVRPASYVRTVSCGHPTAAAEPMSSGHSAALGISGSLLTPAISPRASTSDVTSANAPPWYFGAPLLR